MPVADVVLLKPSVPPLVAVVTPGPDIKIQDSSVNEVAFKLGLAAPNVTYWLLPLNCRAFWLLDIELMPNKKVKIIKYFNNFIEKIDFQKNER